MNQSIKKALSQSIAKLGHTDWYLVLHYGRFIKVLDWLTKRTMNNSVGLEVGVWPGYVGLALHKLGYQVTGIDIDPNRIRDIGFPIRKLDLNFEPLPFPNNTFDFINCSEVIEHLDPKAVAMFFKEVNRILKPGGIFIVTTPNKWRLGSLINRHRGESDAHGHGHELEYGLEEIKKILQESEFCIESLGAISFYSGVGTASHNQYFYPLRNFLRFPNKQRNFFKLLLYPIIKFIPQLRDSLYFIASKK